SVGSPGATNLNSGAATTVTVAFHPTTVSPTAKAATLKTGSSGGSPLVSLTGTAQTSGGSGSGSPVMISEFRFRGPNGANDEFVELYNNSDSAFTIGGFVLKRSNGSGAINTQATVPAGIMIPARGHYLIGNSASGAPNNTLFDLTYGTGITDD